MKFDFKRRAAEFGGFNNRLENMGSGGEKRKAIDLPARFQVKIGKELDMLVPVGTPEGTKFSNFVYGPNLRKPNRTTFVLSPLKVHRKPEHVKVTIFDVELDKRKILTFEEVTVKDPVLELEEDQVFLSCKLQIHPTTEQLGRIIDNVEAKTRDFECHATAPELFDKDGEEEEEEEQADVEDGEEAEENDDNDD